MYQQITGYFPTSMPQFQQKVKAYCELYWKYCDLHCKSDRNVKSLKRDGDAMDLDFVQKKTVSTVSDRCYMWCVARFGTICTI